MSKLLDRTRELLREKTTEEMIHISLETGLPFAWIRDVRYKDTCPAVDRIEQLYEHLSGHQLEVK